MNTKQYPSLFIQNTPVNRIQHIAELLLQRRLTVNEDTLPNDFPNGKDPVTKHYLKILKREIKTLQRLSKEYSDLAIYYVIYDESYKYIYTPNNDDFQLAVYRQNQLLKYQSKTELKNVHEPFSKGRIL